MTGPRDGPRVPLEIRAAFTEQTTDLPAVFAYAFSQGGALLALERLDEGGNATLVVDAGAEGQAVRVVLAPEVDKERLDVGELLRRGGVERHVRVRPDVRLGPVLFELDRAVLRCWIASRRCTVRGTLVKRIVSGGVPLRLPVCDATVEIYEVDPWPLIIRELPDLELDRLREILDGPWPPIRLPIPPRPPELSLGDLAGDLLGPRALNPQPLPPRQLAGGAFGAADFDPQPDPPGPAAFAARVGVQARLTRAAAATSLRTAGREGAATAGAAASPLPADLRLAARVARPALERAILGHLELLRPLLCWLYPRFVRTTLVATATTDECGHFRAIVWRACGDTDQPDLYFVARQRFFGTTITILAPTPIGCHTWWNYACGTEVTLVTTHPLARVCPPCPPVVAPNNWVLFLAIGNTSVWRIHGANDTTRVGAAGHDPAKLGLLDGTAPWGGTLRPRLEFDNSLRGSLGVRYYRVSYKRPGEPESAWRPSTEAVNRHYTHEVGGELILEQYALGPNTVGGTAHLYEIPPALPPTGQWSIANAVLDTQSAVVPTADVAPGTGFDAGGDPIGADQGGRWQLRVELFDAGGALVDPEALGIVWRVPRSDDLTGTIQTADAATLGLVDAALDRMVLTVHVDNNRCEAAIGAPTLDGSAAADACGVMNYATRTGTIAMPFLALQRNRFASFSFAVQRGAVTPPEVSLAGTAAASAATAGAPLTASVDALLDTCAIAGFTEQLYVAHMATDGWSRQSQYDDSAARAFVLAPVPPTP